MRLFVTHATRFTYSGKAFLSQSEIHLRPRDCPNQVLLSHELWIEPEPEHVGTRRDYFGNTAAHFTVHEPHRSLLVRARSSVAVAPTSLPIQSPAWDAVRDRVRHDRQRDCLEAYQFVFPSPRVECSAALAAYARESFLPGRPILEATAELNRRIYTDFTYEKGATDVGTPVAEAFAKRRGVCQDFAHVMVGCLRSVGVPARYVSGYLVTRREPGSVRLVGSDESHAWAAIYALEHGWIGFDPTNDLVPSTEHVTVAWGRDYSDVSPVKGVTLGGGEHTVEVLVDVEARDREALPRIR